MADYEIVEIHGEHESGEGMTLYGYAIYDRDASKLWDELYRDQGDALENLPEKIPADRQLRAIVDMLQPSDVMMTEEEIAERLQIPVADTKALVDELVGWGSAWRDDENDNKVRPHQ